MQKEINLPQNISAEESVLGALMIDGEGIYKVVDFLKAEDFYRPQHQRIYQAMLELFERKEPIDILTVTNILKEKNLLEEIGGESYLVELIDKTPTTFNLVAHARIVRQKSLRRQLIQSASEIYELAQNEEIQEEELIDQVEEKIFKVAERAYPYEFAPVKEFLEEAYHRIEEIHRPEGQKIRGLATGFNELDQYLAGLQKSDLIILASRPSYGKTSFALDIARYVGVKLQKPVGIFSLEMSKDQIIDRLLAGEAMISLWKLRTGKLGSEGNLDEFSAISDAMERLADAPIYIDDNPALTVLQMRAMARRLQAEKGLELLIIDYLQLIRSHKKFENRVQEITEISRSLKSLARELKIPVIAISQLSRAPEHRAGQVPKLSDLRESGSLEQDADVVIFIHRPDLALNDPTRRNQADIIIAKHRNGPLGVVSLYFDPNSVSFHPLETVEEIEIQ